MRVAVSPVGPRAAGEDAGTVMQCVQPLPQVTEPEKSLNRAFINPK